MYATLPRSGKTSYATCHACSTKGSLSEIVQMACEFYDKPAAPILEAIYKFEHTNDIDLKNLDLPSFEKYQYTSTVIKSKKPKIDHQSLFYVFPNGMEFAIKYKGVLSERLSDFYEGLITTLTTGHKYYESRGVDLNTQKSWELFYTKEFVYKKIKEGKEFYLDHGQRAIFIIRDQDQKIVGFSARALGEEFFITLKHNGFDKFVMNGKPKYIHATGFKKTQYLYGESKWNERPSDTIVLCEGFFDAIKIYEATQFNVGAIMGAAIDDDQVNKITKRFKRAIFFHDNDKAGITAKDVAKEKLIDKISFAEIESSKYPENAKDAGDMTPEQIRLMLSF